MLPYLNRFERYEKKYRMTADQYHRLRGWLKEYAEDDQYGKSDICSLYFDTPDHRLIRASLDRPAYKEKLRLRSYGVPNSDSMVFAELKKKYQGVVYKRRVGLSYADGVAYLCGKQPAPEPCQIIREIDWMLSYYQTLAPSMVISYQRIAMAGIDDPQLRITFDSNILWREDSLTLSSGIWGTPLLKPGERLMEIKLADAMPLWLSHLLDRLHIYPVSYSKYGSAYLSSLSPMENSAASIGKEAEICA